MERGQPSEQTDYIQRATEGKMVSCETLKSPLAFTVLLTNSSLSIQRIADKYDTFKIIIVFLRKDPFLCKRKIRAMLYPIQAI
jgi:hypothetical protein